MKFKCEIDMDNAAFKESPEELERCLNDVIDSYDWGSRLNGFVYDLNGNKVGQWEITE